MSVEEDPDQPGYFMRRGMSRIGAQGDLTAEGLGDTVPSAPLLLDVLSWDEQQAIVAAAYAAEIGDAAMAEDFREEAGYHNLG